MESSVAFISILLVMVVAGFLIASHISLRREISTHEDELGDLVLRSNAEFKRSQQADTMHSCSLKKGKQADEKINTMLKDGLAKVNTRSNDINSQVVGIERKQKDLEAKNATIFTADGKLATDSIMFQKPGSSSNTDPYSLRKIIHGKDKSSMRLTINDNPDEVFEIWGDSCRNGGCKGAGAVAHKFTATGDTWHKGGLTAGKVEARTANVKGAITAGKVEAWTVDGKGAVRGGRVEAGGGSILTGNSLKTNGKVQKGRMHFLVDENLYICPKGAGTVFNTFNGGNPKIMMQSGGKGKHHAAIKMDGTSITGDFGGGTGRMHVSGKGDLLVLKEKGLHVGHWWGGEPIVNISSGGGKTGKFCIDNICISKEDLKKIKILK